VSPRELEDWRIAKLSTSLGPVDPNSVKNVVKEISVAEKERLQRIENRPPLGELLNLHDFEVRSLGNDDTLRLTCFLQAVARAVMPEKAWAYYSSAADDEITNRENHLAYHRCVFTVCIVEPQPDMLAVSGSALAYS